MPTELTPFTLTPSNLKEAMEFSKIIAESDLVPKDYKGKPGNVLVAVQMGLELGLPPLQAIQGIAVIGGRPCVWGDLLLALVRASPHFESIEEEQTEAEAVCRVKRRGEAAITRSFSIADAKTARLAGKEGPWQQYPRRMLQMRARALALRDAFADVLKGISMAEEAQDMPDRSRDIEGTTVASDLSVKLRAMADSRADVPSVPKNAPRPAEADPDPTTHNWIEEISLLSTEQEVKDWYERVVKLGWDNLTEEERKTIPEFLTAHRRHLKKMGGSKAEPAGQPPAQKP